MIMDTNDEDDDIPQLVQEEDVPILDDQEDSLNKTDDVEPCPITVLTGFLGAGKTTLLDYILNEQHDRRIAVIMNEFGDSAGIESKGLSVSDPENQGVLYEEMLELNNGCICCTVKDNGVKAIESLMEKRRESSKGKGKAKAFDYILLETTGLADPVPVAQMFWQDEALASEIYLDAIVCVVDAVYALRQLSQATDEQETFLRQIASADTILLNKTDLVDKDKLQCTISAIRQINTLAPMHHTVRGVIDLSKILGLNAYSADRNSNAEISLKAADADDHIHDANCEHRHDAPSSSHAKSLSSISTLSIPLPTLSIAQQKLLDSLLRSLLWEGSLPASGDTASEKIEDLEILRTKGIFQSAEEQNTYVIQGVREIYEIKAISKADEDIEGRLVLIGRGLQEGTKSRIVQYIEGWAESL